MGTVVRVPASTANLGPGFDAVAMALDLWVQVGTDPTGAPERAESLGEGHPAMVAFRHAGGTGPLWLHTGVPSGRGLGYSGAVRLGGALAGLHQGHGDDDDPSRSLLARAEQIARDLEGHPDNVAASAHGGLVVTARGCTLALPVAWDPTVVIWVPSRSSSTARSRVRLWDALDARDLAADVAATALLVGALVTGDTGALGVATAQGAVQAARLARQAASAAAIERARRTGACATWLSGSGPAVVALGAADVAANVASALGASGRVLVTSMSRQGAHLVRQWTREAATTHSVPWRDGTGPPPQ